MNRFRGRNRRHNWRDRGPSSGGRNHGFQKRDDGDHYEEGSSSSEIPSRPPPGLRGKALGFWYRDRQLLKNKAKKSHQEEDTTGIPLEVPWQRVNEIRKILGKISMAAPPIVSNARSADGCLHAKYSHIEDSEFKRRFMRSLTESIDTKMKASMEVLMDSEQKPELDESYYKHFLNQQQSKQYIEMQKFRHKLPAWNKKDDILQLVNANQVVVISGETGCGKTTQVPQFILDNELNKLRGSLCHVIVTQPRRISAISVAERVAAERGEKLGNSVGFQIRLEKQLPRSTGSILFCTTGILLQFMQSDPVLRQVSHIILDEIHERDCISDFVITILKDVIKVRKDLKVILMSATLNAEEFTKYYNYCPMIEIPGFTYPVVEYYLEDILSMTNFKLQVRFSKGYRNFQRNAKALHRMRNNSTIEDCDFIAGYMEPYLRSEGSKYPNWIKEILRNETGELTPSHIDMMVELIVHICQTQPPGAILVFLPGWDKISSLTNALQNCGKFPSRQYLIIPLHSMLPTLTQRSVFDRPPPGVRKIVVATNIAETSITIDDVVYVIDCGLIKIKNFDVENNLTTLREEWVSLANAKQRRGRAGRVQDGVCYHMYSRPRESVMEKYQLPEMLRTRLEEIILQIKVLQLGKAGPFLSKVMNPPSSKAIELSVELLRNMKALDEDENLTPLGYHLANLPIDPQAGKMILLGALFSCIDPITSIAASLSFKDAFVVPMGKEKLVDKVKCDLSNGTKSDHILMAEVISLWRDAERNGRGRSFTSRNFLAYSTLLLLEDMKNQFASHLYYQKFLNSKDICHRASNLNSNNEALIKAIICAGLFPNIAIVKKVKLSKKTGRVISILKAPGGGKLNFHPKSVNSNTGMFESCYLAYYLKIKSQGGIMLHDTTMILPLSLIFFSEKISISDAKPESGKPRKLINLHNNIVFNTDPSIAGLIIELRAWLDWLLEHKVAHPNTVNWEANCDETLILRAINEFLTSEFDMFHQGDEFDEDDGDDDFKEDDYDDEMY